MRGETPCATRPPRSAVCGGQPQGHRAKSGPGGSQRPGPVYAPAAGSLDHPSRVQMLGRQAPIPSARLCVSEPYSESLFLVDSETHRANGRTWLSESRGRPAPPTAGRAAQSSESRSFEPCQWTAVGAGAGPAVSPGRGTVPMCHGVTRTAVMVRFTFRVTIMIRDRDRAAYSSQSLTPSRSPATSCHDDHHASVALNVTVRRRRRWILL